jgi:hypothetical protein
MDKQTKLLDQDVDQAVADFILKKVDEFKAQVDQRAEAKVNEAKEKFQAKADKLFAHADKVIEEGRKEAREEFSAKLMAKLDEKNQRIADLEQEVEDFKETLAERVNTFLTNSKDEIRTVMEEESRVDADEFKAQHKLEQIAAVIGIDTTPKVDSVDEAKAAKTEEEISILKERVAQKNQVNKYLKAQVRRFELVESVPSADRDFYLERLEGVETVEEADTRFEKIKVALDKARVQQIEEELGTATSKGTVSEETVDYEEIPTLEEAESQDWTPNRWKSLAGIK